VIDERNLKIMNLSYLHPKRRENVENKNNSPVKILLPKHQPSEISLKTSDLRNFSQNIRFEHQKWRHCPDL